MAWLAAITKKAYVFGMDLRRIRHFRQIAESGSFSAASGVLHIAQPALSRQMRALEKEMGAKLFHRTGRGIFLTAAGQVLMADSTGLMEDAERLKRRVRELANTIAGEATVGLSPTIGRLLTLPLLTKVRSDFPALKLRVSEALSGTLLEWLQAGRLDAAVIYHTPVNSTVRSEVVAHEPLSVIGCASALAFPPGCSVLIAALAGKPLVLPTTSHGLRHAIDTYAAAAGVKLDLHFEFDSLDATIELVKRGMALTILPHSAVAAELDTGALMAWRIGPPELSRPLVIATAAQRRDAISAREIAALLRQVIMETSAACGWHVHARKDEKQAGS